MTIVNTPDLCRDIAEKIADRIGGLVNRSNQSSSVYVDASVEIDDGDDSLDFCIRVSDHEARSYNRSGNYAICVAPHMAGDCDAFVRAEWIAEEFEMDCGDGETVTDVRDAFRFDADAARDAVEMAVAAFDAFKGSAS